MFIINTKLVKNKIHSLGMNMTSFGNKINIPTSTLSYIINNKTQSLNLDTLYKICNELKINIDELIINDDKEIRIKSSIDTLTEIQSMVKELYQSITTLKESQEYNLPIIIDGKNDNMLFDKKNNEVYYFDIKSKPIYKNNSYDFFKKYYLNHSQNDESNKEVYNKFIKEIIPDDMDSGLVFFLMKKTYECIAKNLNDKAILNNLSNARKEYYQKYPYKKFHETYEKTKHIDINNKE